MLAHDEGCSGRDGESCKLPPPPPPPQPLAACARSAAFQCTSLHCRVLLTTVAGLTTELVFLSETWRGISNGSSGCACTSWRRHSSRQVPGCQACCQQPRPPPQAAGSLAWMPLGALTHAQKQRCALRNRGHRTPPVSRGVLVLPVDSAWRVHGCGAVLWWDRLLIYKNCCTVPGHHLSTPGHLPPLPQVSRRRSPTGQLQH